MITMININIIIIIKIIIIIPDVAMFFLSEGILKLMF